MEVRVLILVVFSCISWNTSQAQTYIHQGLIRSQGTIAVGRMPQFQSAELYTSGNLEYYVSNQLSVRSDSYYHFTSMSGDNPYRFNHSVFSGASYHFSTQNKIDPYIGFQPGISVSQISNRLLREGEQSKVVYSPLVSGVAGIYIYAEKYFHFFADARYLSGQHLSETGAFTLNEWRFMFGLGFNLR